MTIESTIRDTLADALEPEYLEVVNESSNHRVPPGAESHFKVTIVSAKFEGERLIARHRRVNAALAALLAGPVHALALHTYTRDEWRARIAATGAAPESPPCAGASRSA